MEPPLISGGNIPAQQKRDYWFLLQWSRR